MRTPWVLVQLLALSLTFGCFDEGDSERPEATGGGGSSTSSSTGGLGGQGGIAPPPDGTRSGDATDEAASPGSSETLLCEASNEALFAPLGRVDAFASAQFAVSQLRHGRPLDSATLRFSELESLVRTAEPPKESTVSVKVLAADDHFFAVADLDLAASEAPVDLVVVLDNGVRRNDGMYREVLAALKASMTDNDSLEVKMAHEDGTLESQPNWATGFQSPPSDVLSTLDTLPEFPAVSGRVVLLTPGELDGGALGKILLDASVVDPTLVQVADAELDSGVRFAADPLYAFTALTGGRALYFGGKDEPAAFLGPRFDALFRGSVEASVEFRMSAGLKPFDVDTNDKGPGSYETAKRIIRGGGRFQAVGALKEDDVIDCGARWIQASTLLDTVPGATLSAEWQTLRVPAVLTSFDAVIFELFQVLSVPTPKCSDVSGIRQTLIDLDCLPEAQDCRSEELIEGLLDRLDEVCAG